MKFIKYAGLKLASCAVVLAGLLSASSAHATPLIALNNPSPFGFTLYTVDFTATSSNTTLTALFRQDPAYWSFDDVSVTLQGGGSNLVVNGGFETGAAAPWYFVGQQGLPAAGVVSGGWFHSGSYSWVDGAVGGVDGIAQNFATNTGSNYTLSFWLAVNGGAISSFEIYAGEAVTSHEGNVIVGNPQAVPDSAGTIALLGLSLTAIAAYSRKKK